MGSSSPEKIEQNKVLQSKAGTKNKAINKQIDDNNNFNKRQQKQKQFKKQKKKINEQDINHQNIKAFIPLREKQKIIKINQQKNVLSMELIKLIHQKIENQLVLDINIKIVKFFPVLNQLNKWEQLHKGRIQCSIVNKQPLLFAILFTQQNSTYLKFLLNEQMKLIQGDIQIWEILNPFQTGIDQIKVGELRCETNHQYLSDSPQQKIIVTPLMYNKWEQKFIQGGQKQMKQFQNKAKLNLVQYKQINKYFQPSSEKWLYTFYVKEQTNIFVGWILENIVNNQREPFSSPTIISLMNDFDNKTNIYIEGMKKILIDKRKK